LINACTGIVFSHRRLHRIIPGSGISPDQARAAPRRAVFPGAFQLTPVLYAWQWLAQLLKLLWVGLGLRLVLKDWKSDLVEPRRRLRLIILGGAGVYILAVLIVEWFITGQAQAWVELANVSLILLLTTLFCTHIFVISPTNFFTGVLGEAGSGKAARQRASALAGDIVEVLNEGRFYARDETSIKALAAAVHSQEYQVRRVINGELGYRNFNTFINRYRVEEIARRLQQPEFDGTPVLSLALDAGFRSLAPFNKAFKERFTLTPSEFRTQQHHQ